MKTSYAFFDVDGTLLQRKSMFEFHDFWYQRWTGRNASESREEYEDVTAILRALSDSAAPRELINRRYYEFFAGRSVDDVEQCARAWARGVIADPSQFVHEVIDELNALRAKGIEPVFVSGSFEEALAPIAEHLNTSHVLATRLLHEAGKYTGRFRAPQTIGSGKALAIASFLAERAADPANCWAFGDDISDVPMLETVGHPVAVIGDPSLNDIARSRGWRSLHLSSAGNALHTYEGIGMLAGGTV